MSGKLDQLLSSGIVAVVRKVDADSVVPVVDAFIKGGITGIEITVDSERAYEKIAELRRLYQEQAVIGAGTVVKTDQAKEAIEAGADFIFAPTLSEEVVKYTKEQGKIMIPGVFTPTEMYQAVSWGADVVKIFPASVLGPGFIKDVSAPLGGIRMMPTGGVNLENVGAFISAGAEAAGIGGSLVNKTLIKEENWDELTRIAKAYVEAVNDARNNSGK